MEIKADGSLLVAVAAETEAAAAEGVAQLKVDYEVLEPFVADHDLDLATEKGMTRPAGGGIELDEALGSQATTRTRISGKRR